MSGVRLLTLILIAYATYPLPTLASSICRRRWSTAWACTGTAQSWPEDGTTSVIATCRIRAAGLLPPLQGTATRWV